MINNKMDLFFENVKALENIKGSWGMYGFQIKSNALNCTMRNQKIDTDRINSALDTIKDNTSLFSYFRGINKLTTAITISFEDNMEESLHEIMHIYDKLKGKFSGSEYLIIAAQVIFNARKRINIDEAVNNTKAAYDYMKKYHRFLTGQEDIANAAIIATTSNDLEETFKDIEENFACLKANKIFSNNNIQALSHILSLINLPASEKCAAVLEMNSILKDKKAALKEYNVPMLSIISFLSNDKQAFADKIAQVSMDLKQEKGFGNFSLGADFRNMISAALVSMDYLDNLDSNNDMRENIINNANNIAVTIAIAVQTAVLVSSAIAVQTATTSTTN